MNLIWSKYAWKYVRQVFMYPGTEIQGVHLRHGFFFNMVLLLSLSWGGSAVAQGTTWKKDAQVAALKYAENLTREQIKSNSKAAIIALYKKLYRSGRNKKLSRTLANIALSTEQINQLAENTAEALTSSDPQKRQAAAESLVISLGTEMAKMAKNKELRRHLTSVMGKAAQIKEVAGLLGAAGTRSGNRALAEYAGDLLVNATPAAAIVGFYKGAAKTMKYIDGQFVASEMEELYQRYKKGGEFAEKNLLIELQAGAIYGRIVRDKKTELRKQREAAVEDASEIASKKLIAKLIRTTDEDIYKDIVGLFKKRKLKEEQDAKAKARKQQYQAEAKLMLDALDSVSLSKFGKDWYNKHPVPLDAFIRSVKERLALDGVFDPHKSLDIRRIARLKAIELRYGKDSDEYKEVLVTILKTRKAALGSLKDGCVGEAKQLALRLRSAGYRWEKKGNPEMAKKYLRKSLECCTDPLTMKDLVVLNRGESLSKVQSKKSCTPAAEDYVGLSVQEKRLRHIRDRLSCLGYKRQKRLLKSLKIKLPKSVYNCVCRGAGVTLGGHYDPQPSKNCNSASPCKGGNLSCVAYGFPEDPALWSMCINIHKIGATKDAKGNVVKPGMALDELILKKLDDWKKSVSAGN